MSNYFYENSTFKRLPVYAVGSITIQGRYAIYYTII